MSKKGVIVRTHNSLTTKLICILSLVLILMAFITSVNAQVLYGSLTGAVTDPSGAAVGAASVEAVEVQTGVTQQAKRTLVAFTDSTPSCPVPTM